MLPYEVRTRNHLHHYLPVYHPLMNGHIALVSKIFKNNLKSVVDKLIKEDAKNVLVVLELVKDL